MSGSAASVILVWYSTCSKYSGCYGSLNIGVVRLHSSIQIQNWGRDAEEMLVGVQAQHNMRLLYINNVEEALVNGDLYYRKEKIVIALS